MNEREILDQAIDRVLPPTARISPILWHCLCGQFNSLSDARCLMCGRKRPK